jgi:hypothetical protein
MTRSITTIVAALAVAAMLALSAASASATTWHHEWSYFHFPAVPGDASGLGGRTLTLKGTYRWRAFSAHWAHQDRPTARSRTLRLYGRYRWDDLMQVEGSRYVHTSALTNLSTGGQVTIWYVRDGRYGDGQYHWGSTLDNVRAR